MGGTVNSVYQNLSYALNLQTEKLAKLQEQAATGSRVNKGSDDPSSAYRIVGVNSQASTLSGYVETRSMTSSSLEISLTIIEDMVSAIADTKVSVSQVMSGIYGETGRQSIAEQVDNTLEQINEIIPRLAINDTRHAEIQHADHIAGQHKNVARMRVRMKKTVIENLFENQISAPGSDNLAIEPGGFQPIDI